MEQIQFLNYLFSIGALVLSGISIYLAIQVDKIKEEWKQEARNIHNRIDDIKVSNNSRKL